MKKGNKMLALMLSFALAFSSLIALGIQDTSAASSSKVYVVTKLVFYDYDADNEDFDLSKTVLSYKYDKNGLIKTSSMKMDNGNIKVKTTYAYGKKSQLKNSKSNYYYLGMKISKASKSFTMNGKGYLKKAKSYGDNGKLTGTTKYTRNKKGRITKERVYNSKGKLTETRKYAYNGDGNVATRKTYNAKGRLTSTLLYEYVQDKCICTEYDGKGNVKTKSYMYEKNGNPVKTEVYDADGELSQKLTYSYKLTKTTKKKRVNAQQNAIADIGI